MAVEVERLLVSLEARLTQFERGFERARATSRSTTRQIEVDSDRMAVRVQASFSRAGAAASAAFKAGITGLATGALGAISIEGVAKSIADLAKLQDVADRTGASTKLIQEFGFAVRQSGGEMEDVEKGLQKFAVNLSKAGQGGGDLFKILEANNVALRDQSGALRPVGDLLGDVAELIRNASSEQDQLNIATAAFGRGAGAGLVQALAGGRKGLAEFAAEAERAGIVLDGKLIKKAADLDDQIGKLGDQIDTLGKKLLVEFAGPALKDGLDDFLKALREASTLLEAIRSGDVSKVFSGWKVEGGLLGFFNGDFNKAPAPDAGMEDLERRRKDLQGRIAELERQPPNTPGAATLENYRKQLVEIEERIKRVKAAAADVIPSRVGDADGAMPLAEIEVRGKPTVMPSDGAGGGADPKMKGLSGEFAEALQGMIAAAKAAGHDISIVSGKRSAERQAELFAAAVRKYGSVEAARKWVAPPGASFHNKGTAADLGYGGAGMSGNSAAASAARAWAHRNAASFGLNFPMGHEPWHVEPQGQRGRAGGALTPNDEKAEDARTKAAEDAARRVKDVADAMRESDARTASLSRESEALNQSAYAKAFAAEKARLLADVEKEGLTASPGQVAAIDGKAAAYARQAQALQNLENASKAVKEAQSEIASIGAEATKGIVADLREGKSAAEAFSGALDRILTRLTDNLIDSLFKTLLSGGSGGSLFGGAGLLGGLFGGARAAGGPVEAGKVYMVGEKGPEPFIPGRSGTILPNASLARVSAPATARAPRSSISPTVNMRLSLDGANGDAAIRQIAGEAASRAGHQAYQAAVRAGQRDWPNQRKRYEQLKA